MRASTLALAAIPTAALAVLAALFVAGIAAPDDGGGREADIGSGADGDDGSGAQTEDGATEDGTDATDGVKERPRRPVRVRAGTARPSLDPALTAGLSSPDAAEREKTALALLERGTEILDGLHYVQPKTKEGAVLLSKIEIALGTLRRIERGADYGRLDEESRAALRLKYWGEALPPAALVGLRRSYWEQRVATNVKRLEIGGVTADEAAFDELELARARLDAGETTREEWHAARERLLPAATRHLAATGADKTKSLTERDALAERLRRLTSE